MNTFTKYLLLGVVVVVVVAVTGCALEAGTIGSAPPTSTTTVAPTETAVPTETSRVETPTATATSEPPTTTPTPEETGPTATPTPTQEPSDEERPVAVTHDVTNVRVGPGLHYQVSHVLPAGVSAQILGRNEDSTWWVVPGPGDGPGPNGWIAGWVVTVRGDVADLPIVDAPLPPTMTPSPTATTVPVISDPGSPPSTACVAVNPNEGAPINVHLGPGPQFALIARLIDWAEVLTEENGWYEIRIAPGQTGWIPADAVNLTGPCDEPEPPAVSVFPIVDGDTGALLGSWHDGSWLHAAATARQIGEARYRLFAGSTDVGAVEGSAPQASEGVCNQPAVTLSPTPPVAGTIGVTGPWNATPRTPALAVDAVEPKEVVAELLRQSGIPEPDVQMTEVWEIDIEGDGTDELVIAASRFAAGSGIPSVSAGDYSLLVIKKIIDGNAAIVPVVFDVYLSNEDLAYPSQHSIDAMLDLNGDGRLELVVRGERHEGRTIVVYELSGNSAHPVLEGGCVL